MTRSNLSQHLSWLLRTRPFVPPPAGPPPPSLGSISSLPGASQASIGAASSTSSSRTAPLVAEPPERPRRLGQVSQDPSNAEEQSQQMARLQTEPRSATRSQLLSVDYTAQSARPAPRRPVEDVRNKLSSSVRRRQASPLNGRGTRSLANAEQRTPSTPLSGRFLGAVPLAKTPTRIDAIDLTGDSDFVATSSDTVETFTEPTPLWMEDSASRQEPLGRRARKRKSEEYASDMRSPLFQGRTEASASPTKDERPTFSDFVAIENFDEPPPPYSPVHPGVKRPCTQYTTQHSNSADDFEREEYSIMETRIRFETRKRRSFGTNSSGNEPTKAERNDVSHRMTPEGNEGGGSKLRTIPRMTYPQERQGKADLSTSEEPIARDERQTKLKKPKTRIIADSEDEEDELAKVETISDLAVGDSINGTASPSLQPAASPRHRKFEHSSSPIKPATFEAANTGCEISITAKECSSPSRSRIAAPPSHHNSTKFEQHQSKEENTTAIATSDDRPESDEDLSRWALNIADNTIEGCIRQKKADLRKTSEAIYGKVDARTLQMPLLLKEQADTIRLQIDVLASILKTKEQYKTLANKANELRTKLLDALDAGGEMIDHKETWDAILITNRALKDIEIAVSASLRNASFSRVVFESLVDLEKHNPLQFGDVMVRSTQVSPEVNSLKEPAFGAQGIDALVPTDLVRQTQMPYTRAAEPQFDYESSNRDLMGHISPLYEAKPTIGTNNYGQSQRRSPVRATTPAYARDHTARSSPTKQRDRPRSPSALVRAGAGQNMANISSIPSPQTRQISTRIKALNAEVPKVQNSTPQFCAEQDMDDASGGMDFGFDENDFEDDDEPTYSRNMGSPANMQDDFDDYGHDDDDEMLEMAQDLENRSFHASERRPEPRQVFAETSGNQALSNRSGQKIDKGACEPHSSNPSPSSMMRYAWSPEVKAALKERFHLRGFRQNQLEAINATLAGNDAFVLMPTGGGKSLCYQLPSIITKGKTSGVTVVVSPLLSLMQDQVEHLQELHIQAFFINGEVTAEQRRLIFSQLRNSRVDKFIQLLYITPEMVSKSQAMISAFQSLHENRKLARLVIDEAHCVSQWGHDFRPDYKLLGEFRSQFPGVPVMALTATATENVKVDVIHNLGMEGCETFTQSFNRPNLTYEVLKKGKSKDVIEEMASIIGRYKKQSGIVYCLSRKTCEKVAEQLCKEYGIQARHYHAGMDSEERTGVQRSWQAGQYHVIVATIAFGMGIDKPDVRFVIHHTIPKSLEGYYQETGRAGRDGKRSGCYLFYGYQDIGALQRMIEDGEGSYEQKDRQRKMLRNVTYFCENKSDCRRVQILAYFSEHFRREDCNNGCDNCNSDCVFESHDFTDYASSALSLVKRLQEGKVTLLACVDIFRGAGRNKAQYSDLPEFGVGSKLNRGEAERLFYRLLAENAIKEINVANRGKFPVQYVRLGKNCSEYMRKARRLRIQVAISPTNKSKRPAEPSKSVGKHTGVTAARHDYPQSTNVSSPVQEAASRKRAARLRPEINALELHSNGYERDNFVVTDDELELAQEFEEDSDEDAFEPIRVAGKPRKDTRRELGPPITQDQRISCLNEVHQFIVEDFMVQAKQLSDKILIQKGLRAHPFTDTVLTDIAMTFPKNHEELLEIKDIDPEKVKYYGNDFLKIIRRSFDVYQDMMRQREDRPIDPNHRNVIDISSDGEDDGTWDELDLDDLSQQGERSQYFEVAPEVEAFNAHFPRAKPVLPPQSEPTQSKFPNKGGRARGSGGFAKGGGRRLKGKKDGARNFSGASNEGAYPAGISKKKTFKSKASNGAGSSSASAFSRKAHGGSKGGGGGGKGPRGIGMMPT